MIKRIESKDNQIIKQCLRLKTKKYRDKEGLYLIEGPNLVEEAVKNGAKIRSVLMTEDMEFEVSLTDVDIYFLGNRLFTMVSSTETPQGIMAIVEKDQISLDTLVALDEKLKPSGNILVLDKLQDPGNIGTMIRTADAAGYEAVFLVKGSGDIYSPKVVRSAAGSLFRVPMLYIDDYDQLLTVLKKLSKKIVATGFDTESWYYDEDLTQGIALVIGNEGNGVNPWLFEKADKIVKIPMEGNIESLNAAVAAGILMYERLRNIK